MVLPHDKELQTTCLFENHINRNVQGKLNDGGLWLLVREERRQHKIDKYLKKLHQG